MRDLLAREAVAVAVTIRDVTKGRILLVDFVRMFSGGTQLPLWHFSEPLFALW